LRPATDLFNNLQQTDASLLHAAVTEKPLQPVSWDRVLEQVWIPAWNSEVAEQREALQGLTVRDLGDRLPSGMLSRRLKNAPSVWPSHEELVAHARGLAACALALALYRAGWSFHTLPGEAYCVKAERRLEPFQLIGQLATGQLSPQNWTALCDNNGISALSLVG